MFFLQVGVEHDDPAGEERERQLGPGGLDLGHWHRSGRQTDNRVNTTRPTTPTGFIVRMFSHGQEVPMPTNIVLV